MKLLITIPAYNEEESIQSIIERSLAARDFIYKNSPIKEVEITVVSDGSWDKTVEIARRYEKDIRLIAFPKNRGYGVAIKEGWKNSTADFVSFLDADGTCDPNFFADLCREAVLQKADVVLGCRLNAKSRMPVIRRIGNTIFAFLLSLFSEQQVRDTASGMRVVRRSSLKKLFPLPDGMHFTPAMSARAVLSDDLKIIEIDMPYHEREGESKLNVIKDGLRFLRVILESAFLYCPFRIFSLFGIFTAFIMGVLMLSPVFFYLTHFYLEEWMIYRFVVCGLMGISTALFFCSAHISEKMISITLSKRPWNERKKGNLAVFFAHPRFWALPAVLSGIGGLFVLRSACDLLLSGHTDAHWSRYLAMAFCVSIALILTVTKIILINMDLIAARVSYIQSRKQPDL